MKKFIFLLFVLQTSFAFSQTDTNEIFAEGRWTLLTSSNNVSIRVCYKKYMTPNVADKGYLWCVYYQFINSNPYAMRTKSYDQIAVDFYYYSTTDAAYKSEKLVIYDGSSSYCWISENRVSFGSKWVYSPYEIVINGCDKPYFYKKE